MCSWNLRDKIQFKKIEELGTPDFYATLLELGIDFIPIVHAKFSDTGDLRGKSCFEHVIEKIDLINRSETRLHEMFYNFGKDFFVMIPNPKEDKNGKEAVTNIDPKTEVKIEKDGIFVVPESYSLESLTIDAKFDAGLAILDAVKLEVEKDLPEIKYFNLDGSNLSGKAIKTLLSSAVDRAEEAQASLIAALIRADEIALTIGNYHNIFMGIGSYESGSFEHSLIVGEMFPMTIDEKALAINALTTAGLSLESALKLLNFTEDEIATMIASAQAEAKLKSPMQNFNY
jgi:hypothetical protein